MPFDLTYSNFANLVAEGNIPSTYAAIKNMVKDPAPTFTRMVVLDVITDPTSIDDNKIAYWTHVLGVANAKYSNLLPRNSIVAQRVVDSKTKFSSPIFLFPFFPSHLSLPCKPGEVVWSMFEDPNAREKNLGFWFCRISEPHIADDVNHTHVASKLDKTQEKSITDQNPKYLYELQNGVVSNIGDVRSVISNTEIINPPEALMGNDVFERIIEGSDASKLIQYEAVPRFKKRPGDVALEGSNNSLIVLGTDRVGSVNPNENENQGFAGSIDLVAGRGSTQSTSGTSVDTTRVNSSENNREVFKKEIGKFPPEIVSPQEGDVDLANDRSRILISQKTKVDQNFGISSYNSQFQISDDATGDSSITIKTDKVRIIARSDISLIVMNYNQSEQTENNPSVKIDNNDQTKWASITIKTNGDIVFTPSSMGFIKLGGDSADRAVVCTNEPASPVEGQVQASPIFTTGNSNIATSFPGQGTYAKKILVVG